jgi:hypothetical protein
MNGLQFGVAMDEANRAVARSLRAEDVSEEVSRQEGRTSMQEARYLGHLEPGMDVCDVDGNKFGTIGRIYRHEMAMATVGASGAPSAMPREDIIETKTGLLGLGKHIYIPFSAIQDVTSGCVFVNLSKERIDEQGWEVKPDYLDELT